MKTLEFVPVISAKVKKDFYIGHVIGTGLTLIYDVKNQILSINRVGKPVFGTKVKLTQEEFLVEYRQAMAIQFTGFASKN